MTVTLFEQVRTCLAEVEIAGAGFALHWPARDADLSLSGLMHGTFGTKAWMTELARRAGRITSPRQGRRRARERSEGREAAEGWVSEGTVTR